MEGKNSLEKKIMNKIKTDKISIRSKYIFLAEKLGFNSVLIFSITLSVLFLSLILFYFKSTDNLIYLSFSSYGLFAFLESFPYLLVICFVFLIFLVGFLLTKTEIIYKKSFAFFTISFLLFIFFTSSLLAFTSMNKKLEYHFFNSKTRMGRVAQPFSNNLDNMRKHSIAGMILYYDYSEAIIQLPIFEKEIILDLREIMDIKLKQGDFVVAVGDKLSESEFVVKDLKIVEENEIDMIKNRIGNMIENDCMKNTSTKCRVINDKKLPKISEKECFEYCIRSDWGSKSMCEKCMNMDINNNLK